jgi:hypothetical protein
MDAAAITVAQSQQLMDSIQDLRGAESRVVVWEVIGFGVVPQAGAVTA